MTTAEIRLQLVDAIMHMTEERLMQIKQLFEKEAILSDEQHAELMNRSEQHKNGQASYRSLDDVKSDLQTRFS